MPNDNVIKLIQPGAFDDQLTEVLRNGARALLAQAVEAEVADFLGKHADLKTEDGHQPRRPPRPPAGARGDDRHRPGRRPPAARARSRGGRRRSRPHPVLAVDPAALHAPLEVDRDAAADPLPEGYLDRRLLRGAGGAARQGCCRVVGIRHRPPEGRLARRPRRVAEARSVGEALRLRLGGWHPSPGAARRREAVHPRHHRRDAGGPQGTGRLHRWRPRKCARLA